MGSDIKKSTSRSWFAVFDNPQDHGYAGEPEEICERLKSEWILNSSTRSGAWVYCISSAGLHHVHMVLEDKKLMRWSVIKSSYAQGMHFEVTRGKKDEAEDYIYKRGEFEEAGEQVIYTCIHGEIKGNQGKRTDLSVIYELVKAGCSDYEICEELPSGFRYLKNIESLREMLRYEEFKDKRRTDLVVEFWFGAPGTGKTSGVLDKYGDSKVYIVSDYKHPWDNYRGEEIVLFDDFDWTQIDVNALLRWLDIYPLQLPCRYNNKTACYTKVYFTCNIALDMQYRYLQKEQPEIWEALLRRIHKVKQFKKNGDIIEYKSVKDYMGAWRFSDPKPRKDKFVEVTPETQQQILDLFGDGTPGHAHT